MKFTWIGGPSCVLDLGPFRLVSDPVFADSFTLDGVNVTRKGARPNVDTSRADAVLVTSPRADHYDPAAITGIGAPLVLAPAGIAGARTLAAGESTRIEKPGATLDIHALPASGDTLGWFLVVNGVGSRTFTACITGDALFSERTRDIQRTHGYSNLLVLHAGGEKVKGELWSADTHHAMQIIYRMQPNAVAIVHHDTFSHYAEPVAPLFDKASVTLYEKRLRALREGESFEKPISPTA